MAWVKARELFTGEYISEILNAGDESWFSHHYWKVIGHKHEEGLVLLESSMCPDRKQEIPYDTVVRTRPFGYKTIRTECLSDPMWKCYKEWPYDENGTFCDPPRDYSGWRDSNGS